MLWLGAGIYWIESFFFPLEGLGLLVLPLACVGSLLPLAFDGVRVLPYSADPLFKLHFVIANVAYGLLTLAALHAVLMLFAERRLHALRRAPGQRAAGSRDWLGGWIASLPPLLTLEKLLFRLITAGFVMLTLTLGSGVIVQRAIAVARGQFRSQDGIRLPLLGNVRRLAARPSSLRLAWSRGVALGAGLIYRAVARLRGQPVRLRSPAAPPGSLNAHAKNSLLDHPAAGGAMVVASSSAAACRRRAKAATHQAMHLARLVLAPARGRCSCPSRWCAAPNAARTRR